jgi:anaerobic selenocysteine-containing dehydrogenase
VQVVRTVCPRDCYDTCHLEAVVEGGRLTATRPSGSNPLTQGFLCARGLSDPRRVYSGERVLYPHVRAGSKPGRSFRRVSWDEALEVVVGRLREVLREHGPGAVLHVEYAGNMGLLTWYYPQRFWNAIGAARTDYSICSRSGHEALSLHYGLSHGRLPWEIPSSRLLVFWGFNAPVSSPHMWALARRAREAGAAVVAVDPRRSEVAEQSDLWLSPRPGTDVALAYGVARALIENGWVDGEFLSRWASGFEEFREEALRWGPERVERVTGVRWELVEELARLYYSRKPSITFIGFGVQKSVHGAEAVRAVSLLPALVGLHRGFYYSNSRGWLVDVAEVTGEKLAKPSRVVSQVALADAVERGEFRFIFVYNSDIALTLPASERLRRGLSRGDVFVVVHDTHWGATAEYADVVLPAPTYLEKDDVVIPYSHDLVALSRRAVEPLGESRSEVWLACEMARRMGLPEWVCEDPWRVVTRALRGAVEGDPEDLLRGAVLRLRRRPLEEYQTPSGRVEFYSSRALEAGLSPLPVQPELEVPEGYFILLNSATPLHTHTQFRDVHGPIPPVVHVNPRDAEELGVRSGDLVVLSNEEGRVVVRAVVTDRVPRGVLWSPRQLVGLDGSPQNTLASTATQRIGGGPTFNYTLVRLEKAAAGPAGPETSAR